MNVVVFLLLAFGVTVADCKADGLSNAECYAKVVAERQAEYKLND